MDNELCFLHVECGGLIGPPGEDAQWANENRAPRAQGSCGARR